MNSGIHYRVYYALYLIEYQNTELVKSETQGEDKKERKLTPEQQRIVNHVISPNDTIKIVAFAGSGKTTTLLHFSKARPNVKFLNLMFNKSASDIAKRTFPSNVTSQTIHSLAFEAIGHSLKHKLKFKINPNSLYNFVSAPKKDKLAVVGMILRSINAYCNSVDEELTLDHVPDKTISKSGKNKEYTVEQRQSFVGEAKAIWLMMINPKKKDVPISHDVYLKLFQLSKPVISSHDCILIDEAQDCSPVMLDIIQQQTMPKIFVGDPHQQIYAFRGAVNALTMINSTHTYYLTQSFRFGPEVAYIANCILEKYKNVTRQTLVGCAHSGDVTGSTVKKPIAILGRTNYGLFKEALELVSEFGRKFQGHFIGGFRFYNKEQLYDIYNLYLVQEKQKKKSEIKLTDKVIKELGTFKALELYVEAAEDQDLRQRIQIVKKFGSRAVEFIEQVEQCCNMPFQNADYIFSTVHKCKGMEFETVQLAKDNCFISCKYDRETGQIEYRERTGCSTREEPNIMYVAVTRAMKNLVMSSHVLHMLHCSQERFEYPVSLDVAQAKSGALECIQCLGWPDDSSPKSLVLYRRELTLSNKVKVHGGPICSRCSTTESFNIVNNVISSRPAFMYKNIQNTTYLSMAPIVGPFPWEVKNTIKCADVKVTVPSYRVDFSQDDDLEEIEVE